MAVAAKAMAKEMKKIRCYENTEYKLEKEVVVGREKILDTNTTTNQKYIVLGFHDDKTIKFYNCDQHQMVTKTPFDTGIQNIYPIKDAGKKRFYVNVNEDEQEHRIYDSGFKLLRSTGHSGHGQVLVTDDFKWILARKNKDVHVLKMETFEEVAKLTGGHKFNVGDMK